MLKKAQPNEISKFVFRFEMVVLCGKKVFEIQKKKQKEENEKN